MSSEHIHVKFWVEELNEYGIKMGPNGEALDSMDYYDLRAFLLQQKLRRDLEPKASPWF
ncbi:hypothetical protein B0H99_101403 [Planomicrobium soli]|uniref:Fur-regulated basic protein A n=1 Tax=Planomicrobium soli TaxID=1176648 RepID=A0A2P8H7E2_9BACL|nr:hypothetical protein [Planomicrobium soli]PSL42155.1 hypothetical protein B0H99_101403 [Planomicrobium soli]